MPNSGSKPEMNIETILVERRCPGCSGTAADTLFVLRKDQFVFNNPTHNLEWFEALQIPANFEFPFLKCVRCGFVYTKFRLNDDYSFKFYNEGIQLDESKAKIFKKSKRVFQTEIWLNLLKQSADKPHMRVLDYGAGWGDFLAVAKSFGVEVVGVEFDRRKIDYANNNGIELGDLTWAEQKAPYNIFMCNQVLEHLNDPKVSLIHLRSLLQDDSIGFFGVPNFDQSILEKNVKVIKQGGVPVKEINPFGHLNYFSPASFASMLESTGFKIIDLSEEKDFSVTQTLLKKVRPQPAINSTLQYVKTI